MVQTSAFEMKGVPRQQTKKCSSPGSTRFLEVLEFCSDPGLQTRTFGVVCPCFRGLDPPKSSDYTSWEMSHSCQQLIQLETLRDLAGGNLISDIGRLTFVIECCWWCEPGRSRAAIAHTCPCTCQLQAQGITSIFTMTLNN